MAVTTQQIAELAGVSRGTVDRVLNGRSGVSPATRRRVEEIAGRMGYVPHRAGKALSSGRRPLPIGLILNCLDNPFYDQVIRGIESCREAYPDFTLELRYRRLKGYNPHQQAAALEELVEEGVRHLLITPIDHPQVAERINRASDAGVTVATLNSDIAGTGRLFHVGCDYRASGRAAAGMAGLLAQHRPGPVGVVTGSLAVLGHRQRVEGFLAALGSDYPSLYHAWTVENNDDDGISRRVLGDILSRRGPVSAVFFAAAGVAGGVEAVRVHGGEAPLIITCDDVPQTRQLLLQGRVQATICQEPYRQGYEALARLLEHWITGRPPAPEVLYMKNEVKIRQNMD